MICTSASVGDGAKLEASVVIHENVKVLPNVTIIATSCEIKAKTENLRCSSL